MKPGVRRRQILRVNGAIEELPGPISIGEAHKIIGADTLEVVMLKDGVHVLLVDDNGIAKELPYNTQASVLYRERCGGNMAALIFGDAIIVPDVDYA